MSFGTRLLVVLVAASCLLASSDAMARGGRGYYNYQRRGQVYHRNAPASGSRLPYPAGLIYNPNAGFAAPGFGGR